MSHFVVIVALPDGSDDPALLDQILAPYDENLKVPLYPTKTVAEIIGEDLYRGWIAKHPEFDQAEALRQWLGEDASFDASGRLLSTYNPKSKWDWWEVGGRWDDFLTLKNGTVAVVATVADLEPESIRTPFAYIDSDGQWHERGHMGWFGISTDNAEQEIWDKQYLKWIADLPRTTTVVVVDCHI